MKTETAKEASRLLNNMSSMGGYQGTTTADVVEYVLANYSGTVFCYGKLRNIVFTPITPNTYAFKTEAAWIR